VFAATGLRVGFGFSIGSFGKVNRCVIEVRVMSSKICEGMGG
jgi:hypothetical protein